MRTAGFTLINNLKINDMNGLKSSRGEVVDKTYVRGIRATAVIVEPNTSST